MRRSYFISTLRVSWNLIEAEIMHNPGNSSKFGYLLVWKPYFVSLVDPDNLSVSLGILNLTDSFDMGFDIQHYYSLHQNLTLEDLAKASSRHTLKGLVKVINKVSASIR